MTHRAEGSFRFPSLSEPQRAYFYRLSSAGLLVAGSYGLIDSFKSGSVSVFLLALFGLPISGLAAKHTSTEAIE
ncbi:hypothetical protein [Rhodococcus qingshengii]|uniref:hypothetical protein n=1 Tax=Rhodococcus qingshengii TaxID=334542 RepID=UPI0035D5BBE7